MRTLKKTLCLVLALVLCLGLVGTAFAANYDEYTDAATVGAKYAEAVDVMMGAGIISGMSATEIGATGTLTREQAAKIVAYMKLGAKVADALKADAAPFKDVAADRWSAGYIAYCAKAGILDGIGGGKFDPAGELTGYAFAKMLLVALGYKGAYTGESWAIAVAQDAFKVGLFKGDETAAVNTAIQRQQAMLVAFNALTAPTTTGSAVYIVTDGSGNVLYTGPDATIAAVMKGTAATNTLTVANNGSLAATVFGLAKSTTSLTDDYGRPAAVWTMTANGVTKTIATCVATPVISSTKTVLSTELYNTLGFNAVLDASASSYTAMGITAGSFLVAGATPVRSTDYDVSDKNVMLGGNGIITEIYKLDVASTPNQVEYAVVQIQPTLFKLGAASKVAAIATRGAHTDFTVGSVTLSEYTTVVDPILDYTNFVTDAPLAKNDLVLVYGNVDAGYTVDHATTVVGKMTAYNSATTLRTIAGQPYAASAAAADAGVLTTAINGYTTYNTEAKFVVDTYGYVMGTTTHYIPTNYVYVVNATNVTTLVGTSLKNSVSAKVLGTDGNVTEVTVGKVTVGSTPNTTPVASDAPAGLYTYTVNARTGAYELTAVSAAVNANLTRTTLPTVATGVFANASTKFLVLNWAPATPDEYDRVAGTAYFKVAGVTALDGFASVNLDNVVGSYIDANGDGIAEIVMVYTNGTPGASANYIYYLGTYNYDAATYTYTYDVIKGGEKTTMTNKDILSGITAGSTPAGLFTLVAGAAAPIGTTSSAYAAGAAKYCAAGVTYGLENKGGLLFASASASDAGLTTTAAYIATVADTVPVYTYDTTTRALTVGTAADLVAPVVGAKQVAIYANLAHTAIDGIWVIK